jgi:hypothetical protein
MPERHALIIGAMKCGTTSAFHYLSAHPEIAPSRVKEPDFFTENWQKGWDWYEALWEPKAAADAWALEASTAYTKIPAMPSAAERIATTRAEYRFIYLMREFMARIQSHRRHYFLREHEARATPRAVTEHMINLSRYAMQLDEYEKRFPREHLLLLAFEDLRDHPARTLQRICEFLEIDPTLQFPVQRTTFNKSAPDGSAYRLLKSTPILSKLARSLPLGWRREVRNRLAKPPPKIPDLSRDEQKAIDLALRDDLVRLREHYGFDTSVWTDAARKPEGSP